MHEDGTESQMVSEKIRRRAFMDTIKKIGDILAHDEKPFRHLLDALILRLPFDVGEFFRFRIRIQDYFIRFRQSSLTIALWHNPNYCCSDYVFITSYLKENDVYIDVGANIGTTLIPAAKCVKGGTAIGVEPHPKIFKYLKENVSLNNLEDSVELHNCALGNEPGYREFSGNRVDDTTNRVMLSGKGIRVPVRLLDDIGERYSKIDLVKIDVEGYEQFVIEGGVKTLKKSECIYFEASERQYGWFQYSMKDLLNTLVEMGFHLFIEKEPRTLEPIDSEYKSCGDVINVLAIRNIETFIRRTGWRIYNDSAAFI